MNDMETDSSAYSMVGGINQQTRNVDYALLLRITTSQ